jgi:N-acetylmuramoyl-L-alanine amidase
MIKKITLAGAVLAGMLNTTNLAAPNIIKPSLPIFKPTYYSVEDLLHKFFRENEKEKIDLDFKMNRLSKYETDDFSEDSDQLILARMLLGECETCSNLEKISIAYTAINRLGNEDSLYGNTLKEVILQPYQYSCFNSEFDSSIFLKIPLQHNLKEFIADLQLAKEILSGRYKDPTGGATYYYNPDVIKTPPSWTRNLTKVKRIGYHIFYKEKEALFK